ncbi:MAG TPA: hypothetical protein VJO15_06645, partial [Dehalococcoidia bacterium]|nr:hypothetical protein [Dehalococcoidia bacterium]
MAGFFLPGSVLAHERRNVGKYQLVVGFLEEPALSGQPNGVSLVVTNTETNQPVEGLQQSLEVQVTHGGKTTPVSLEPRFRMPGNYAGHFIPTRPGAYMFRFFGQIEGLKVDERFESGPSRFDDVEPLSELQFPDKVPDGLDLEARLQKAEAAAQDGRNLGILLGGSGAVLGALGTALGLVA